MCNAYRCIFFSFPIIVLLSGEKLQTTAMKVKLAAFIQHKGVVSGGCKHTYSWKGGRCAQARVQGSYVWVHSSSEAAPKSSSVLSKHCEDRAVGLFLIEAASIHTDRKVRHRNSTKRLFIFSLISHSWTQKSNGTKIPTESVGTTMDYIRKAVVHSVYRDKTEQETTLNCSCPQKWSSLFKVEKKKNKQI